MSEVVREYSSYKDPIASLFYYQGEIYRYVDDENFPFFEGILRSEFCRRLMDEGDIVQTETVTLNEAYEVENLYHRRQFFRHQRIPFISYPYEWPFSMFKDAALFTLNLQKKLISENLSLKDATPFNVQFRGAKPVFVDFCSIEPISKNGIWFAYNQFMQMFAYPLMLRAFSKIDIDSILITHIDGVAFEDAHRMLGLKPKLKLGLFTYLLLPRMIFLFGGKDRKELDARAAAKTENIRNNQAVQTFMINRLIKLMGRLKIGGYKSDWSDYSRSKSYSDESESFKMEFVRDFFRREKISSVIDLGANTGEYSIIAAESGCEVTAVDSDHDCIDYLYIHSNEKGLNILPLCLDISNPTPSIGWNNRERTGFLERFKADCLFALALVHHLLVSGRQPLHRIVELFARLTNRFLIVEYIGRDDSMFQLLIKNRRENYDFYNLDYFKTEFQKKFRILIEKRLPGMDRMIFLLERSA